MSKELNWTLNGPQGFRIIWQNPGHIAAISLRYDPTPAARDALNATVFQEIGGAVLADSEPGPAAQRLQRLQAESRRVNAKVFANHRDLTAIQEQRRVAVQDDSPGLAARVRALALKADEANAACEEAHAEFDALAPHIEQARQEALEELKAKAKVRNTIALAVLENRRRGLEAEILAEVAKRLTALVAIEQAKVIVRSSDDVSKFVMLPADPGEDSQPDCDQDQPGGGHAADTDPPAAPAKRGRPRKKRVAESGETADGNVS